MFNSTKLNDTSKFLKTTLLNPYDDSIHEQNRTFLSPKITSTPLHNVLATPPKNQIMTPRRYSLSEVATPPRNRRDIKTRTQQYPPGPLLGSTQFNLSVSTFEDAKSPGLVSRIVQYNDEAERRNEQRRPATHQAKYGTVGLFPIVHLFKNKLPVLEQKPRHVTIRVATPDRVKHTPEYNRKLLEGLVKPSGSSYNVSHLNNSENSTSPRSVLDALKEISRKRIHVSEEVEIHEDTGKRLRTEDDVCTDSNKRGRDDSPQLETSTSPIKPASKKICMYDEYSASRSSTDFSYNRSDSKRKYISTSTVTENPKESKQVKLINVETQTVEEEKEEEPKSTEDKASETEDDAETEKTKKVKSILKVFDDSPLDRIRKNRLAALMGNLVGKDPVLKTKPDLPVVFNHEKEPVDDEEVEQTTDKPLVSILAQKSPKKAAKHVTFNIPETTVASNTITISSTTFSAPSTTQASVDVHKEKIPESTSPISTQALPTFTFNSPPSTTSLESTSTASPTPFTPKSLTVEAPKVIPSFNFGGNKNPASSSTAAPVTSPPKAGGFKFDLQKPASTVSTSPTVKSSFLSSQPSSTLAIGTTSTNKTDTSITFGTAASSSATSSESAKPSFTFGPPNASSTTFNFGKTSSDSPISKPNGFPSLFVSTTSGGTGFNTVTTSAKTSFSTITSVANKNLITSPSVTTSTYGTASTIPTFANFQPKTDANTFGTTTGTTNGVGTTSTPAVNFAAPVSTTAFGVSTTNTAFGTNPNFVVTTTPSFGSTSSIPSFGTTTPGFGTVSTTTTNSSFGTTIPNFGTTAPGFGTTSTTTTSNPSFGTTTPSFGTASTITTSNPSFGTTTPSFGTTTSGFGTTSTATTTSNTSFGTTTPNFGITASSGFGNTAAPGFGTTTPAFGTATTQAFGSNATSGFGTTVTTANNIFGPSTTTSTFGGGTLPVTLNSSFGAVTTAGSGFGTALGNAINMTPGFGTPTTSTFTFGGSTTPSTGFGIVTTSSGFVPNAGSIFSKSNVPNFGGTTTPSFGSTSSGSSFSEASFGAPVSSTSAFGTATTTSSFSFGGANASFSTPATTSSMFGTTQSPFGGGAVTTTSSNINFNFTGKSTTSGTFPSTNTVTPSFGSTFGQSGTGFGTQSTGFGTNSKSTFGNATPGFGSNAAAPAPAFGASQPTQPFGTASTSFNKVQSPPQTNFGSTQFSFNQQPNSTATRGSVFTFGSGEKPGVFNFGAPSGETAKKFDFNAGGSTAPPAFGASFGPNTSAPAFGAAPPLPAGGFSIGAGPQTSKRTQIKAKRRT